MFLFGLKGKPSIEFAALCVSAVAGAAFAAPRLASSGLGYRRAAKLIADYFEQGLVGTLPIGGTTPAEKAMEHATKAVSRLEFLQRKHDSLTTRDGITGLYNQAFVMERLRLDFERGKRSNDSYAVLVFHLDQLGFVASHGGEADAEAALRHVANSLRKHMDTSDWLGRWDGGEFVGVLWGADEAAARDTCCRLQDSLADDGLMREGRSYSLSLSSGVLFPGRDETFPQLVERIRACLVTVRERGRNSLTVM